METYEQLMEQAQELGIKRTAAVQQWLAWREDDPGLQEVPLMVYLDRMRFFNQNINRARGRDYGWVVEIDEYDCYIQGYQQDWRCAITGDPLEFTRGGQEFNRAWANPRSCTNDRIDPEQGYTPDNLQLVTWEANLFKQAFTMRDLENIAVKMIRHRNIVVA